MGKVINIKARLEARLCAELEAAGRAHAEAVLWAADIARAYRQRSGDRSSTAETVVGLALTTDCQAAGARLLAARSAFSAAGLPLPDPDIEIADADEPPA
jgi:hypothetical protein